MKPQLVLKPKIEPSFRLPEAGAIEYLNVHQIVPNPFSSRRTEDPESLAQFANHLVAQGLLEPITVRVIGHWSEDELPEALVSSYQRYGQLEKYEIICGWRRWAAIKSTGALEIEANIYEQDQVSDADSARMSLSENLLRQSLNPIDEVAALLQVLLFELAMPQSDLEKLLVKMHNQVSSKKLKSLLGEGSTYNHVVMNYGLLVQPGGKDVEPPVRIVSLLDMYGINLGTFVCHKLPLLKLPADLANLVISGVLSPRKALLLHQIKDEYQRQALTQEALKYDYSFIKLQQQIQQLRASVLPLADNSTTLAVNSPVEVVNAEVVDSSEKESFSPLVETVFEPSSSFELRPESPLIPSVTAISSVLPLADNSTTLAVNSPVEVVNAEVVDSSEKESFSPLVETVFEPSSSFELRPESPLIPSVTAISDEQVVISDLFLPVVQTCDRVSNLAHRAIGIASTSIEGERLLRFREWLNECNQQSQHLEAAFNRGLSEFGDLIGS